MATSLLDEIKKSKTQNLKEFVSGLNKSKDEVYEILLEGQYTTLTTSKTSFEGIELLKWIRVLGLENHCILTSFMPLIEILKLNPSNNIIASKGTTFLQLPFKKNEIDKIEKAKSSEKSNRSELQKILRVDVDITAIRHELANWWGCERLKIVYESVTGIKIAESISKERKLVYEIVKFINNNSINDTFYISEADKNRVLKKLNFFQNVSPPILYFDDEANNGWGDTLQLIFGKGLIYEVPNPNSNINALKKQLKDLVDKHKPKCLLLDLRLQKQDKISFNNPLKYSGGILLKEIKNKQISLPIIMFTASNRATNMRALLDSGIETLWTKEGADLEMDNTFSFYSFENLIKSVYNSVSKFKSDIYKEIYESEVSLRKNFNTDAIKDLSSIFNFVFFDTNFFIGEKNFKKNLINFKTIDSYNQYQSDYSNKIKIVIHEDVLLELANKARFGGNKDIIILSQYALKFLYGFINYSKKENFEVINKNGFIEKVKKIKIDHIPLIEIETFADKILNSNMSDNEHELNTIITQIINTDTKIKEISNKDYGYSLHADDIFPTVILEQIKENISNLSKGVLFVSNDKECAVKIIDLLINSFENNPDFNFEGKFKYTKFHRDKNGEIKEDNNGNKIYSEWERPTIVKFKGNVLYEHRFSDNFLNK